MDNKNKNVESPVQTNAAGVAKSVLALSVVISLLIGLIGGFFFGENRTTAKYEKMIEAGIYNTNGSGSSGDTEKPAPSTNPENPDAEKFSSIDYTTIKINDEYTIESFYSDDESRYYASNIIGKEVPNMEWVDAAGESHSTKDLAKGQYIIELFSSTCSYCNQSIPEINSYRASSGNKIISLCLDNGDLTNFNADGEFAWILKNQGDAEVSKLLSFVPWIPTILYVDNGVVKLVSYGATTSSTLTTNWGIAFGK